jgi:hypothetical protein
MRISSSNDSNDKGSRPLSTADLARAARRPDSDVAGTRPRQDETVDEVTEIRRSSAPVDPETDYDPGVDYEETEVTRLDVAQPPNLRAADARDVGEDRERESIERVSSGAVSTPQDARPRGRTEPVETLDPLFPAQLAESFRTRWTTIQGGFVDDPRQAVRHGDELVAEVMSNLAESFAGERQRMEAQLDETGEGATENLRVALRRYRSFFERLLAL